MTRRQKTRKRKPNKSPANTNASPNTCASMARTVQRLVHTTGLDTISGMLNAIPKDLRTEILAQAVAAGAKPIVIAAKRFAKRSQRTGAMREAIGSITRKYPYNATAVEIVGVTKGYYRGRKKLGKHDDRRGSESPSHYAHLVEFGHHAVAGGSLRAQYNKELVGIGKFSHKGNELKRWKRTTVRQAAKGRVVGWVAPKPFLRPAMLTTKNEVTRALTEGIAKGIEKTRAKLIKSGAHAA